MTAAPPSIDRGILTKLLQGWLPAANDAVPPPLVLVHARYPDGDSTFKVSVPPTGPAGRTYCVTVTDQPSVLGVVDAWQRHHTAAADGAVLVVTTGAAEGDLGWELRSRALGRRVWGVERAELVRARFQAPDADPRIAREDWLVDGLLAAEPATGWPPAGGVLTRDLAVQALVEARLGLGVDRRDGWDVIRLLDWSGHAGAADRFAALDAAEQKGLADWLGEQIGPEAGLVLALAASGRGRDAMALGVVCSLASAPNLPAEAAIALGGLLGSVTYRPLELKALAEAVAGTLSRWVAEAANAREPQDSEQGLRVLDVVRRADALAAGAGLTGALATHPLLPSALDHQVRVLAHVLAATNPAAPSLAEIDSAEAALDVVAGNELVQLDRRRRDVATMAVRLQRWLATPVPTVTGVGDGVLRHVAEWGWVDRALDLLWAGDPGGDGVVETAYRRVHDTARARRDRLDEEFAARLVPWAAHACTQEPAGCLLVEDVLATLVAPLARQDGPAPLVLVLDGMSSAVAAELAGQVPTRGWMEVAPHRGRRSAAVSMLPTVTQIARTSLLSGRAVVGDQANEESGFTAFWKRLGRAGRVFHKGDLAGRAGQRLSNDVMEALSSDAVVAVVLNTVDDALDHGQEGDRTGWTLRRITYLSDLLDAARGYGRPLVLTSDHGHVLDRSLPGEGPTTTEGAQSARWRTGTAGAGEVEVTGPRVLLGGGHVVLPWRESIRYTPRKSGYHGGASLAEVTVPVVVLLPDADRLPEGWSALLPGDATPAWWTGRAAEVAPPVPVAPPPVAEPRRQRPAAARAQEPTLFDDLAESAAPMTPTRAAAVPPTLGQRVVASEVYEAQKAFVPKSLDKPEVATVLDALVAASGTLPVSAVATLVGRAGRRAEQVVTTLERLLNVEGYEVITRIDGGQTLRLNVTLLAEQFRVGEPS